MKKQERICILIRGTDRADQNSGVLTVVCFTRELTKTSECTLVALFLLFAYWNFLYFTKGFTIFNILECDILLPPSLASFMIMDNPFTKLKNYLISLIRFSFILLEWFNQKHHFFLFLFSLMIQWNANKAPFQTTYKYVCTADCKNHLLPVILVFFTEYIWKEVCPIYT